MIYPSIKLSDKCDLITKGTTPTSLGFDFTDSGIPFIRAQNLVDGTVSVEADPLFIDATTHAALRRSTIKPNDVLISIAGTIGRAAIVPPTAIDMNCNQAVAIVRAGQSIDRRFLLHWLNSQDAVSQIARGKVTGTISNLSLGQIGALEIPLPPLEEQKRIAAILDQADALRRLRARALDRLNALGQAIFHEMFGDTVTNPKGFQRASLSELVNFVGGTQPPKSNFLYEDGPDRVRFVQTRDFRTDAYLTYLPKALAKRPFKEDDVMIGRYGPPVFQIFRGLSGTYNVALMKAEPKAMITKNFIFYLLQEPQLHGFVVANSERTAGQSGVNLELLEAYSAFLPPPDIIEEFDAATALVDLEVLHATNALSHADRLFAALQSKAFSGEL